MSRGSFLSFLSPVLSGTQVSCTEPGLEMVVKMEVKSMIRIEVKSAMKIEVKSMIKMEFKSIRSSQ